jgi:hypothetical protein
MARLRNDYNIVMIGSSDRQGLLAKLPVANEMGELPSHSLQPRCHTMKCKALAWQAVLPTLLLALSSQAHDPAEHIKGAEKPDCAAMKNMDPSKMDRDDPVVQAMMQKCVDEMHQEVSRPDDSHTDDSRHDKNGNVNNPVKHEL